MNSTRRTTSDDSLCSGRVPKNSFSIVCSFDVFNTCAQFCVDREFFASLVLLPIVCLSKIDSVPFS